MTKQEAYEIATRKNLSNPNGSRMDIIYAAMDEWANQELAAKDKEIETLTRQVKAYKTLQKTGDEIRAHQSKLLSEAETVESEREANAILTDEIEKRDKEIAELKDTIERMAARLQEMAQDAIKAQGHN